MSCEVRFLAPIRVSAILIRRRINAGLRMLRSNPRVTNVSVAVVDDRRMRELNRRYRHVDRTTDVLSFTGSGRELGEIVVSAKQVQRQSREFETTLDQEIGLLLIHGLLHLYGFDHRNGSERRKMERMERRILGGSTLLRRNA